MSAHSRSTPSCHLWHVKMRLAKVFMKFEQLQLLIQVLKVEFRRYEMKTQMKLSLTNAQRK